MKTLSSDNKKMNNDNNLHDVMYAMNVYGYDNTDWSCMEKKNTQ